MKKLGYRPKEVSVNISELITKRKNSESFFSNSKRENTAYSKDRSMNGLHEFDTPVRNYNTTPRRTTDVLERLSNGHFSENRRTNSNLNFLKITYFIPILIDLDLLDSI